MVFCRCSTDLTARALSGICPTRRRVFVGVLRTLCRGVGETPGLIRSCGSPLVQQGPDVLIFNLTM